MGPSPLQRSADRLDQQVSFQSQGFLTGPDTKQKEPSSVALPRNDLGKARLELGPGPRSSFKALVPGNLAFSPKETGVISPEASLCLVCDILEVFCVVLVQLCLINFLLVLFHFSPGNCI